MSDDFDFDIGSDDEAEMMAASADVGNGKRKPNNSIGSVASNKRAKTNILQHDANSPSTVLANKILLERFGLKSFRLEQEAAITRVLDGGSAVVVFPTGGGKSLCYQVSSLILTEPYIFDASRCLPCASAIRTKPLAFVCHRAAELAL